MWSSEFVFIFFPQHNRQLSHCVQTNLCGTGAFNKLWTQPAGIISCPSRAEINRSLAGVLTDSRVPLINFSGDSPGGVFHFLPSLVLQMMILEAIALKGWHLFQHQCPGEEDTRFKFQIEGTTEKCSSNEFSTPAFNKAIFTKKYFSELLSPRIFHPVSPQLHLLGCSGHYSPKK